MGKLPDHLTPGNPGNSGGKPGRSGRKPTAFKIFARNLLDHPRLQRAIMRKALEGDTSMIRFLHDSAHGKPAQKVVVEGEVDLLVQNVYPGQAMKGAGQKKAIAQAIEPSLRALAAAEGVEVEEEVVFEEEDNEAP